MDRVLVVVVGVFLLGMGIYALGAPAALARPFRIVIDTPHARSEIRAVYGGFGIAIAALLGYAEFGDSGIRAGVLISVAVALAGMAFGRIVSRIVDRPTGFYPVWFYFGVEVLAAAALVVAS